jgi:hypothetical protein
MNIIETSRPWDQGLFVSNLLAQHLRKLGHSVTTIPNNLESIPTKKIDFAFGWGLNNTLKYIRDELNVPVFVFDLGMIKRTESPMQQNGYFRFGFHDEKFIDYSFQHDDSRWKELNLVFNSYRHPTGSFIIMGQVPNDVSHGMDANALTVWVLNIVEQLKRKYPKSNIIYKFHPLVVHQPMDMQLTPLLKSRGVSVIHSTDRIECCDLSNRYRAVFSYCSTSLVQFILDGIPVIASKNSMFPHLVSDIDSDWDVDFIPEQEIKQKWFNAMSFSQWNLDEISNGVMWNYVKKHIGE